MDNSQLQMLHETLLQTNDQISAMRNEMAALGQRLATMEASLKPLLDNGQPGTITKMWLEIKKNSTFRERTFGFLTAYSVVSSSGMVALIGYIYHLIHSVKH